jgi:hypothetical protein
MMAALPNNLEASLKLRPGIRYVGEVGVPTLPWHAKGFANRNGVQAEIGVAGCIGRYPQKIETTITHPRRYSGSQRATILLADEERQIRAEVRDQCCGPALFAPAIGRGTPLGVGMRERVQQLHGVFDIESAPGRGTTVRAVLSNSHEYASSSADGEALEQLKIAKVPPRSEAKRAGSDG